MPKLPFVSYSRIFFRPSFKSHTLILPSYVVLAKNCPSSLSAMAQISPALLPSTILPSSVHSELSDILHTFTSPPNPAVAAMRPFREVTIW
jgi:hypothetical protein